MRKQFNTGRVRRVVHTVTTYVPEEAPSLDIDMEEAYKVQVAGNVTGVDSLQVNGTGRPVRNVGVRKEPTALEKVRATKTAYASADKSGGIDPRTLSGVNETINLYNSAVRVYNGLTKKGWFGFGRRKQFVETISEEVLNTGEATSDLEGRIH